MEGTQRRECRPHSLYAYVMHIGAVLLEVASSLCTVCAVGLVAFVPNHIYIMLGGSVRLETASSLVCAAIYTADFDYLAPLYVEGGAGRRDCDRRFSAQAKEK